MGPWRGGRFDQGGRPYDDDLPERDFSSKSSELTRFETVAVVLGLIAVFIGFIILLFLGGVSVVVMLGWY